MEFRFNLNDIFKNVMSKVDHTLLPSDFSGDRRKALHLASQVAEIVDDMGVASAKAQDLHHPITSAGKMRNSDHTLYIMIDPRDNGGKGSVVGLLKMGVKNLFMFDPTGMVHEKKSLCVLDFYVHESKQRTGMGKKLFDFMLQDYGVLPCTLAIDKPSEKFLKFLYKHYGLAKIYPQNNNFVVFEGFFYLKSDVISSLESYEESVASYRAEKEDRDGLQTMRSEYTPTLHGRHTAFKAHDTMGEIIGNNPTSSSKSPTGNGENDPEQHGRHTAFKAHDTMGEIIANNPTSANKSPTSNGNSPDFQQPMM